MGSMVRNRTDAFDGSLAPAHNDEARPSEASSTNRQSLNELRQFAHNLKADVSREVKPHKSGYEPVVREQSSETNRFKPNSDTLDGGGVVTREQLLSTTRDGLSVLTVTETPQYPNCMEAPFCSPTYHCEAVEYPGPYCADAAKNPA